MTEVEVLQPEPLRLLGGVGGNSLQDQLDRQACLTIHRQFPNISLRTAKRRLHDFQNIDMSVSKIRKIWNSGSVTVNVHGGHCGHPQERVDRLIKLVRGSNRLLKDGTRSNRHTIADAVYLMNSKEKKDEDMISRTSATRWMKAKLKWRIRRRGPGVTETNRIARLSFRERHNHRSDIKWQMICWSDSTALGPDHQFNRHNDGLWVEDGEVVPPLQKLRRPDNHYVITLLFDLSLSFINEWFFGGG